MACSCLCLAMFINISNVITYLMHQQVIPAMMSIAMIIVFAQPMHWLLSNLETKEGTDV